MLDFKRRKLLENKANPLIKGVFFSNPEPPFLCALVDVNLIGGLTDFEPNGNDDSVQLFKNDECEANQCYNVRIYTVIGDFLVRSQLGVISPFNPINIVWLGDPVLEVGTQYRVVVTDCDDIHTIFDNTVTANT